MLGIRLRRVSGGLAAWLVLGATSCQYLKDRALDFTDQYRLVVGAGSVIGVRGSNLGLWDTGLMIGVKPRGAALGWRYGDPLFFNTRDFRADADQAEIVVTSHVTALDYQRGAYYSGRWSVAVLPAIFSWVDATPVDYAWNVPDTGEEFVDELWIWRPDAMREHRYEQIHVFDIGGEIALGIYIDVGYSPGELLDFLLGLFTLDIAGDDGRW